MKDENVFWLKEDEKFINFEKDIKIPNEKLINVKHIILKSREDFRQIQESRGVYWIWTNEPIKHTLHAINNKSGKGKLPKKIELIIGKNKIRGEIIYNGVAQDNIRARIKDRHLFSEENNPYSGISVDIFMEKVLSHKKKVFSKKGKVPYIDGKEIRTKEDALKLFLSKKEEDFVKKTPEEKIYFRNGIKISEEKHKKYIFVVFFIANLKSESYMNFIEKIWRKKYGTPRLCSYVSGR